MYRLRHFAVALGAALWQLAEGEASDTCAGGEASCQAAFGGHAEGEYFWPMQKGDVNRTGAAKYAVTSDLRLPPTWVWKDPNLDVIRSTPLIDDKKNIYLGTQGGRIWKVDPNGQTLWLYKSTRGNIPTVPAIYKGKVYGNTASGHVFALDMETGQEKWVVQVAQFTNGDTACVFALNDTIISATVNVEGGAPPAGNNRVVALSAEDGSQKWVFNHPWASFNFQASSPGDGTVVFQDHYGGVYRLSLATGHLLWESGVRDRHSSFFSTGAAIVGPNGLVYAASNYWQRGIIHAYKLDDGAPVWRAEVGMPANQAVAMGYIAGRPDRLSVVAGIGENPGYPFAMQLPDWCPTWLKGFIHERSIAWAGQPSWLWGTRVLPAAVVALDAETGNEIWRYVPPPFQRPSCEGDEAMLGERLAVQGREPYNIDVICLPDDWSQAVIGADGTAYIGHQDGKLYAIRDANGNGQIDDSEVSSYYFSAAFQASQAIAPGMLAVAPCGGGLYVWKS